MAQGYDSDIVLSIDLNADNVLDTTDKLSSDIEQLFEKLNQKGISINMKSTLASLDSLYSRAQKIQSAIDAMEGEKFETDEFKEIFAKYTKLEAEYDKLVAKKKEFRETKLEPTDDYKLLQYNLEKTNKEYVALLSNRQVLVRGSKEYEINERSISKVGQAIQQITQEMDALKKSEKAWKTNPEYEKLWEQLKTVGDEYQRLGNIIAQMEAEGTSTVPAQDTDTYKDLVTKLNQVNNRLLVARQRTQQLAAEKGVQRLTGTFNLLVLAVNGVNRVFTNLDKIAVQKLNKIASSARKAANELSKMASKKIQAGLKAISKALTKIVTAQIQTKLKSLSSSLGKVANDGNDINKAFKRGFRMLLQYGIGVRSLYFLVRKLRKALGEGLGELAKAHAPLNIAISGILTSLRTLRNSFASAFAPIIETVAPILIKFINLMANAVDKVGMFIAALTGKEYVKAVPVYQDFAASMDSGTKSSDSATKSLQNQNKAAKELKRTLAGFDDVEILHEDRDTEIDVPTAVDTTATPVSFTPGSISSAVSDFAKKFKEAWDKADFYDIGRIVGEKLKNALENIPWDKIKITLSKIAKSIATFLNGFLETPGLFKTIGKTIAEAINSALTTINTFVKNFHWESLGKAIRDLVNSVIKNTDWSLLAETISGTINGMVKFLLTAIEGINWREFGTNIGKSINDIFEQVDFEALGKLLGEKFMVAWEIFRGIVDTIDPDLIGQQLSLGLNTAFDNIDFMSISNTLATGLNKAVHILHVIITGVPWRSWGRTLANGANSLNDKIDWAALGRLLGEGINSAIQFIGSAIENFNFATFGTRIGEMLAAVFENKRFAGAEHYLGVAFNGVLDAINGVLDVFEKSDIKNIGKDLGDSINNLINYEVDWEKAGKTMGRLFKWVMNQIRGVVINFEFDKLGQNIATSINGMFNTESGFDLSVAAETFATAINGVFSAMGAFADEAHWEEWKNNVVGAVNLAIKNIAWAKDGEEFNHLLQEITNLFTGVIAEIDWEGLGNGIGEFFSQIDWAKCLKKLWDALWTALTGIFEGLGKTAGGRFLIGLILFRVTTTKILPFINSIVKAFSGETITRKLGKAIHSALSKGTETMDTTLSGGAQSTLGKLGSIIGKAVATVATAYIVAKLTSIEISEEQDLSGIDQYVGQVSQIIERLDATSAVSTESIQKLYETMNSMNLEAGSPAEALEIWRDGCLSAGLSSEQLSQVMDRLGIDASELVAPLRTAEQAVGGYGTSVSSADDETKQLKTSQETLTQSLNLSAYAATSSQNSYDAMLAALRRNSTESQLVKDHFNALKRTLDEQLASGASAQQMYDALAETAKNCGISNETLAETIKTIFPEATTAIETSMSSASQTIETHTAKMKTDVETMTLSASKGMEQVGEAAGTVSTNVGEFANDYGVTTAQMEADTDAAIAEINADIGSVSGAIQDTADEIERDAAYAEVTKKIKDTTKTDLTETSDIAKTNLGEIADTAETEGTAAATSTKTNWELSKKHVQSNLNAMNSVIAEKLRTISNTIEWYMKTYYNYFKNKFTEIKNDVPPIITKLKNAIATHLGNEYGIGSVVNTKLENIKTKFTTVFSNINEEIITGANTTIQSLIQILNDTKTLETISSTGETYVTKFTSGLTTSLNTVSAAGASIVNSLVSGMDAVEYTVTMEAGSISSAISGAFESQSWYSVGSNIGDGIYNGLVADSDRLKVLAWNTAVDMYNAANAALGIASPSKKFAWIGQMIMRGWEGGLEDNAKLPLNTIESTIDTLTNATEDLTANTSSDSLLSSMINSLDNVLTRFSDIITDRFTNLIASLEKLSVSAIPIPDIARGNVVPNNIASNRNNDSNMTRILTTLDRLVQNQISLEALTSNITQIMQTYGGDLYIGDEQIARHANAGNVKLNRRYNTV